MRHPAAEAMAVLMVSASLLLPLPKTLAQPDHSDPTQPVEVVATDPADRLIVWRAVSRFSDAGLDLPPVVVHVHDDREACGGNRGRFTTAHEYRIDICARHPNPRVEMRWRLRTAVHEFAHAFIASSFLYEDVNTFLRTNELRSWVDRRALWEERGAEVAAESVVVGVLGVPADPRIATSCDELLDNYVYITGTQPEAEAFEDCR